MTSLQCIGTYKLKMTINYVFLYSINCITNYRFFVAKS